MNTKKLILVAFIIVVVVQMAVPIKMILDHEKILNAGMEFRFKAQLAYPESNMSGKYIRLSYDQDKYPVANDSIWKTGELVYVIFRVGPSGLAQIDSLVNTKPDHTSNFVEAKIKFTQKDDEHQVFLEYPFEKFFLEESRLSDEAMNALRRQTESAQSVQSIIRIHAGKAAITDILIDDVSILKL